MNNTLYISEEIENKKPYWKTFIKDLGYSDEQADKFAEGYASEIAQLPTLEKIYALSHQERRCMTAGFLCAGIDENEALNRYKKGNKA